MIQIREVESGAVFVLARCQIVEALNTFTHFDGEISPLSPESRSAFISLTCNNERKWELRIAGVVMFVGRVFSADFSDYVVRITGGHRFSDIAEPLLTYKSIPCPITVSAVDISDIHPISPPANNDLRESYRLGGDAKWTDPHDSSMPIVNWSTGANGYRVFWHALQPIHLLRLWYWNATDTRSIQYSNQGAGMLHISPNYSIENEYSFNDPRVGFDYDMPYCDVETEQDAIKPDDPIYGAYFSGQYVISGDPDGIMGGKAKFNGGYEEYLGMRFWHSLAWTRTFDSALVDLYLQDHFGLSLEAPAAFSGIHYRFHACSLEYALSKLFFEWVILGSSVRTQFTAAPKAISSHDKNLKMRMKQAAEADSILIYSRGDHDSSISLLGKGDIVNPIATKYGVFFDPATGRLSTRQDFGGICISYVSDEGPRQVGKLLDSEGIKALAEEGCKMLAEKRGAFEYQYEIEGVIRAGERFAIDGVAYSACTTTIIAESGKKTKSVATLSTKKNDERGLRLLQWNKRNFTPSSSRYYPSAPSYGIA